MRHLAQGTVVALWSVINAGSAEAQDVKWRTDYAAARKEATSAGKPLLLDFGTESCFWCKKLDATTFRLPALVTQLNGRFIPVKIDAEKDEWLTRAAGVDSFPTLVLVSPDGKIMGRHAGYADATQLASLLAKAPEASAAPSRSVAAETLAEARADHDAGRYVACLERCEALAGGHPGSPEAAEARRLAGAISSDPQKWRKVTAELDADLSSLRRSLDVNRPR
jgi:thioredoxin-like negative regulator of GroEL